MAVDSPTPSSNQARASELLKKLSEAEARRLLAEYIRTSERPMVNFLTTHLGKRLKGLKKAEEARPQADGVEPDNPGEVHRVASLFDVYPVASQPFFMRPKLERGIVLAIDIECISVYTCLEDKKAYEAIQAKARTMSREDAKAFRKSERGFHQIKFEMFPGRVAVVGSKNTLVFHAFIQHDPNLVFSYQSEYSGLYKKHIKDMMPLQKVQEELRKVLRDNTLVGASLLNDMTHLGMWSDYQTLRSKHQVYDIQEFYHTGGRAQPISLKKLAREYFPDFAESHRFQKGEHDPVADAMLTRKLYFLRPQIEGGHLLRPQDLWTT